MILASLSNLLGQYTAIVVGGVIVILGLLVFGLRDTRRFSWTRAWAIAMVCFQQSIRRRVLLITPLVMLGIIAVSQFQKTADWQDSIRQTTMYCLFATGMLVALVTIMLACTNLPREIESRVIYTVATKPTTRLEIVVGKVAGFACVSACILVIMGLFTLVYLHLRDWRTRSVIQQQLTHNVVEHSSRPTMEYYAREGTLHARELGTPVKLAILAHEPRNDNDWWVPGGGISGDTEGDLVATFVVDKDKLPPMVVGANPQSPEAMAGALVLKVHVTARRVKSPPKAASTSPATAPSKNGRVAPHVIFELRSGAGDTVFTYQNLKGEPPQPGQPVKAPNAIALGSDEGGDIVEMFSPQVVDTWLSHPGVNVVKVAISGVDDQHEFSLDAKDAQLIIPQTRERIFASGPIQFAGRAGLYGEQLRGEQPGKGDRVALYEFRDQPIADGAKSHPFEVRLSVEPDYGEVYAGQEGTARLEMTFRNRRDGQSKSVVLGVENNRPLYFEVPSEAVAGGNFDVTVRMTNPGWVNLRGEQFSSLKLVRADQWFVWNLLKSLGILWLMSLMVTIVAVFCSTFLSWPIAIVLTVVILFGRWGAEQLGDLTHQGIGRRTATELFRVDKDAVATRAISETVDALATFLNTVSSVLPDLSKFAAVESIDKGIAIPSRVIRDSLGVSLGYGIPLLVLAYIFLRFKEVAP